MELEAIRHAIDALYEGVRVNGTESPLTDKLIDYLTANIDDVAEAIEPEEHRDMMYVPASELKRLENTLDKNYRCLYGDGYAFDEKATFLDGCRMAIRVNRPITNKEPCWVQGVLYGEDHNELGRTEVCDFLEGEHEIEYDGRRYVVEVVSQ